MRPATLKKWNNAETKATPGGVALSYAASTLLHVAPHLYTTAIVALDSWASGDAKEAKDICDSVGWNEFTSSTEYHAWAQFKALFLKATDSGSEAKRRDAAEKSFLAAESTCKRVNKRMRFYYAHPDRENPLYRVILTRAKHLIARILGDFTDETLAHLIELARPGSGTAIGTIHRSRVSLPFKLGETKLTCATSALPYARRLVESSWHWAAERSIGIVGDRVLVPYELTNANKIGFVPKDATRFRTTATEPSLNIMLQLGVHEYVASRLKGFGVHVHDQSYNQKAAFYGSMEWDTADPLVTLDLRSASDTICIGLVERLLPPMWLAYLDDIRSKYYVLGKGDPVEYQKWSSMGNGYTFVLECCIFFALAKACSSMTSSKDDVRCYGDDLICRRGVALLLTEVLKYCGFSMNLEKSSYHGPFRESCGKDFYAGAYVTPVYLRGIRKLRPTDIYRLLNGVKPPFKHDSFVGFLLRAHKDIPIVWGVKGTDTSECLWTSWDHFLKVAQPRRIHELQAWECYVVQWKPRKWKLRQRTGYLAALFGASQLSDKDASRAALKQEGRWTLVSVTRG